MAAPRLCSPLDRPDRPAVVGEVSVEHVFVGECAVALRAPAGSPGVAEDEAALVVVVADAEDGVAAEQRLLRLRDGDVARLRRRRALEALEDRDAEDER